jgi:hypothetical protein
MKFGMNSLLVKSCSASASFVDAGSLALIPYKKQIISYTYISYFFICLGDVRTDRHVMLLNYCEFCEKRCSESNTSILNVNYILTVYSTHLFDLDEMTIKTVTVS